jgi:DNA modification methylase
MIRTPLATEYLPLMSALPNPQDIFLDLFSGSSKALIAAVIGTH